MNVETYLSLCACLETACNSFGLAVLSRQVYIVAFGDEVWQNYAWEFHCIEHPTSLQLSDRDEEADGELDKTEADIAAAADVGGQLSISRGLVVRIVTADQPTANRVETEVREHLEKLFISATVTDAEVSVLQLYDTIELKSSAGNVEEVFVDIGKFLR